MKNDKFHCSRLKKIILRTRQKYFSVQIVLKKPNDLNGGLNIRRENLVVTTHFERITHFEKNFQSALNLDQVNPI